MPESLRILSSAQAPENLPGIDVPSSNTDRFGRRIDYLRIAITDRCNLRCVYCMPSEGVELGPRDEVLRFAEIVRVAAVARRIGFKKFRITGGEPLVVKDVLRLIGDLRQATLGASLALTTNGIFLASMAEALHQAGVERLNISLDTLRPERFRALTRRDGLDAVLMGLDRALEIGFSRLKINAVIVRGINDDELLELAHLARDRDIDVRFIERMPLDGHVDEGFLGADAIIACLGQDLDLVRMNPEDPRQAAQLMFKVEGFKGRIGVVAPRSQKFCASCNRMRLTPSGDLKGCLLSEGTLALRPFLRQGISDAELERLLLYAIGIKPFEYQNNHYGLDRPMIAIGG